MLERGARERSPRRQLLLKIVAFSLSAVVCVLVARGVAGQRGLAGAAVGVGSGAVLCTIHHGLAVWARRAQGRAILTAMYAGILVSFAFVLLTVLILTAYWREIVEPAAISLLVVYLTVRFVDVIHEVRRGVPKGGAKHSVRVHDDSPGEEDPV
jgi:hypothetical protein